MPHRRCPHCHRVIPGREYFAHLQAHSDQRRERAGTAGGWRGARAKAMTRDRYRCRLCGAHGPLEVHHIDGNWRNNDQRNLITLCDACHLELRRRPAQGN